MLIRGYFNISLNDFFLLCFKYFFLYYSYFLLCFSTTTNIYSQLKFISKFKVIKLLYLPSFLLNYLTKLTNYFNFLYLTSFCLFFEDSSILFDLLNFIESDSSLNILSFSYKGFFVNLNSNIIKKIFVGKSFKIKEPFIVLLFYFFIIFLKVKIKLLI